MNSKKLSLACAALLIALIPQLRAADAAPSIAIGAFEDSAHHWRNIKNPDAVIQARKGYERYAPAQIREIAANILLFQCTNGGWPKNYDVCAVLTEQEKEIVRATRDKDDTTFDNETIHSHVAYLAQAYVLLGDSAYRAAAERGIDFILRAQYPNGGWPQKWPKYKHDYESFITFNDGVMVGNISVMMDAVSGANDPKSAYAWLDDARREKCRDSLKRGIDCLLACQYRDADGKPGAWGQQHDPSTLKPAHARLFEPACLCAEDTVEILHFLMGIKKPSPEIVAAIKGAAAWLDAVKITGVRWETFKSTPVKFPWHSTDIDKRVVEDPSAPPIWARMYELGTNRPIFCGREGKVAYTFAEIDRDRRTGYTWYGFWPAKVLKKEYPAWLKKNK